MASGTIVGSTSNEYIDTKVVWSSVKNTANNSSTVTATLYYKRNNSGYTTYGTGTFYLTINGVKVSTTKYITITYGDWVKAIESSAVVIHNDDGSKSITISASGSMPDTTLSYSTVSGTAKLDTIPRASTITSASNVNLGYLCRIKFTPASSSFWYAIKFALGNWSYTTARFKPGTTAAYTYAKYIIPKDVAKQFPNTDIGTMSATLYTYTSESASSYIGSTSTKTFDVRLVQDSTTKPSLTMTLSPVTPYAKFASLYLQGRSKVEATFTGDGKYGATVDYFALSADGRFDEEHPYTSNTLSKSGSIEVVGYAYDTRNFGNKVTQTINVIAYGKPKILPASGESAIICARCDANGNLSESGTYLKIKARRSYSKVVSDGVQKNFCSIRYRCVPEGSKFTGDEGWVTLLAGSTTSTDTINKTLSGVVSSTEKAYIVQVGVVDDMGESDVLQFMIPTDFVTIDIPEDKNGRSVGLFRYAGDQDGVYVGLPIFGGSVDSLKLGTSLTATEAAPIDLNDVKTPGCYYSPGADYSRYILNSPYTTGGFGLEVRELQSKNYLRQTLYYGRTTMIRHWNTTEWSGWLRYMVSEDATGTAVDFVTEIGVWNIDDNDADKGYWRYRKWKSGAIDMNGLIKVFPVAEGTLGTAGVYYSQVINIDLPFEVVNFQFTGSSTSYHIFVGNANGVDGNNKQIRLRLYRFTDFPDLQTYNVYVRIVASGKLK